MRPSCVVCALAMVPAGVSYRRLPGPPTTLLRDQPSSRPVASWSCSARCSDISTVQSTVCSSSPRWVGCEVGHMELLSKIPAIFTSF